MKAGGGGEVGRTVQWEEYTVEGLYFKKFLVEELGVFNVVG